MIESENEVVEVWREQRGFEVAIVENGDSAWLKRVNGREFAHFFTHWYTEKGGD
jgi:hypothetical protein